MQREVRRKADSDGESQVAPQYRHKGKYTQSRIHPPTHTHTQSAQTHHDYSDRHTDAHNLTAAHVRLYTHICKHATHKYTWTHRHTLTQAHAQGAPDSGSGLPWRLETRPPAPGSQPPPHPLEGRFDHGPIPSRLKDLESPFCLGSSPNRTIS